MWEKTPAWKDFCKLQWSVRLHIPEASFLKASKMKRFGFHHVETFPYTWLQFNDEQDFSQAASQKARDNEGEVGVFHCSGPQKLLDWKVSSYDINIGSIPHLDTLLGWHLNFSSWYLVEIVLPKLSFLINLNSLPWNFFEMKSDVPILIIMKVVRRKDQSWKSLQKQSDAHEECRFAHDAADAWRRRQGISILFRSLVKCWLRWSWNVQQLRNPGKKTMWHICCPKFHLKFENWWAATLFGWLCHVLTCMSFSIGHGQHISRQTPRNALRPSFKCTFAFWPRPPPSSRPSRWKPQTPSTWENHNIKQTVVWLCTKWTMLN